MASGNITKKDTLQLTDYSVSQVAVEVRSGIVAVFSDYNDPTPPYTNHIACTTFSYDNVGILTKLDEDTLTGIGEGSTVQSVIKIADGICACTFGKGGFESGYTSEGMIITVAVAADGTITPAVIDSLQYTSTQKIYTSRITHATGTIYAITFAKTQTTFGSWLTTLNIDSSGNIGAVALDTETIATYREISHIKVADGVVALFYAYIGEQPYWNKLETRSIDGSGIISAIIDSASWGSSGSSDYDFYPITVTGTIYACAYREAFNGYGQVNTFDIATNGTITAVDIDTFQFEGTNVPIQRDIGGVYSNGVALFFYPDSNGAGQAKTVDIDSSGNIGSAILDTEVIDPIYSDYTYIIRVSGIICILVWSDNDSYGQVASLSVVVFQVKGNPNVDQLMYQHVERMD